jgi:type VI secretion system protein ImpE
MSSKAELFLKAGDPVEALAALQDEVRAKPADSKLRIFLFQLMIVNGQWERASKQLAVLSDMDEEALFMVRAYEDVINCERHREAVFAGKVRPIVFGEPEAWVATLIEALHAHCHGEAEQFKTLNEQALEAAPTIAGRINDEGFEWLADADQRFGPVFEMMFNQHYYWVPMSRVKRITTEAPSDLRDLVWLPAEVTWTNGGQAMVMMPARYPDLASTSPQGLLGQHTDWQTGEDGIETGRGQRMLASDVTDYSLLQVRTIEFDS